MTSVEDAHRTALDTIERLRQRVQSGTAQRDRLSDDDARAVASALEQAAAPNTRRAYAGAWASFCAWAQDAGYPVLPATEEVLAAYLAQLAAQGRKLATLRLHRSAVVKAHRLAGHPPLDRELLTAAVKGLAREHGGPQKQATPLTETALAAIRATARIPRRTRGGNTETPAAAARRGALDIAIVSVMRDGLLRVSEAAALTWSDLRPQPDGTALATIRRSKTDTEGEGVLLYLGADAVETLDVIRPETPDPEAPLFGLRPAAIAARIRAAAAAAGLGDNFTGHAARVGMAVDLVADGMGMPAVMKAGRWKSPRMVSRYAEGLTAGRGAVAQYYGRRSQGQSSAPDSQA